MALTYTPAPELGVPCPDFRLPGVDGKVHSLSEFAEARALTIMFLCNHCPYVKAVEERLLALARELQPRGAAFVAICSNDAEDYPEDNFANLQKRWKEKNYPFLYLHDEDQSVAKRFGAVCTPDYFSYDAQRRLAYRGRLDDNWKDPSQVTRQELRAALLDILNSQAVTQKQTPSMGCSIKWK